MSIPTCHADPLKVISSSRTFFVTSSTWGKRNLLQSNRAAELFLRTLYEYRAQGKYRLHEFVVMPDHFHLLISVDEGMTIERAVQLVKGGFAFRAGKELGFRAPVWQKGFSETRVSESEEFGRVKKYIRENPVRRNLAATEEEYPFSSAHEGFELDSSPAAAKAVRRCRTCRHA